MRKFVLAVSLATSAAAVSGCSTNPFTGESQMSDTVIGAGAGAAVGAGAGAAVGSITHADVATSALIGAGVGAVAGAGTGMYMDNQQAKKREQMQATGVSVTRSGSTVALNLDRDVTFASGQSALSPADAKTLDSVAMVLKKYPKTKLDVIGYADPFEGSSLSKQRAEAVVAYLTTKGIAPKRLMAVGTSSMMATASRRVELNLQPLG
ncbi:OmpA family protein [Aestuariivirga litoralis]|uniref:OmpA family protein n=1 Tax=Aestuariivirga litoralis TaxID=2650924 RepID=UPI0018C55497|nr:OmpA family protein [Aestuariivirga litoralis]MBG1232595.1 OmpA family protein [Aestuariivirga litoralis]